MLAGVRSVRGGRQAGRKAPPRPPSGAGLPAPTKLVQRLLPVGLGWGCIGCGGRGRGDAAALRRACDGVGARMDWHASAGAATPRSPGAGAGCRPDKHLLCDVSSMLGSGRDQRRGPVLRSGYVSSTRPPSSPGASAAAPDTGLDSRHAHARTTWRWRPARLACAGTRPSASCMICALDSGVWEVDMCVVYELLCRQE